MKFSSFLPLVLTSVANAVTLTTTTASYTVNADSANAFVVVFSRTNCDITSLKYRGVEVQNQKGMKSHIASGFSSPSVSATTITSGGVNYVKVTCAQAELTHYYVIRDGDSSMNMATYVSTPLPIGEHRWIGRFITSILPNDDVSQASSVVNADGTSVEGSDVFVVGGQTRSKFYSSHRFIDDKVHCLSGNDIKACMVIPGVAYETSSGGPFFRDINTNPGNDYSTIYLYMHSGHVQTEAFRPGLKGPYSLVFSRSGVPSGNLDLSFMSGMGLIGYVPASARGYVSGTATGIDSTFQKVMHWTNSAAQYWVYASSSGTFTSPPMKPGIYTQKLYQNELLVASTSVTVSAGQTVSKSIASTWTTPPNTIFQIGEWDSQPFGFKNADKFLRMHPSDSRMSNWGPLTYTVGTSSVADFPMALFRDQNAPLTIKFTVPASQAGAATLRIGTTLAYDNGRPGVTVNGVGLPNAGAPTKIDSRGVTRGAYRGWGDIYTYAVSNLVAGSNTIVLTAISGNAGLGGFLSANFIFDAIHLHSPNAASGGTNPTTPTTLKTTTSSTASSSTTIKTTTSATAITMTKSAVATTTSAASSGTEPAWGQCGGGNWPGETNCVTGYKCQFSSEWYSQCVPV